MVFLAWYIRLAVYVIDDVVLGIELDNYNIKLQCKNYARHPITFGYTFQTLTTVDG